MSDVAEKEGLKVDKNKLSELLGCPIVFTVATKKKGMNELLNVLDEVEGQVIIWASYRFDLKHIEETLKNQIGLFLKMSLYL